MLGFQQKNKNLYKCHHRFTGAQEKEEVERHWEHFSYRNTFKASVVIQKRNKD